MHFSIAALLSHPILHYCPRLGAEPQQAHSNSDRSASVQRVKTTRGLHADDNIATPDEVIVHDLEIDRRQHLLPAPAVGIDHA